MDVDDYGLTIDYWHDFLETIRQINSEDLLSLAGTYLDPASMAEIVVGKK
jgi:predicted Zn-dependent peptidase